MKNCFRMMTGALILTGSVAMAVLPSTVAYAVEAGDSDNDLTETRQQFMHDESAERRDFIAAQAAARHAFRATKPSATDFHTFVQAQRAANRAQLQEFRAELIAWKAANPKH